MADAFAEEKDEWLETAGQLRHHALNFDGGDEHAAQQAVASLLSEFGYQDAPHRVLEMFAQLMEVGYLTALRDVRDGQFDDELATWRPDICH